MSYNSGFRRDTVAGSAYGGELDTGLRRYMLQVYNYSAHAAIDYTLWTRGPVYLK